MKKIIIFKINKIPKKIVLLIKGIKKKKKLRAPIHKLGTPWLINYLAYLRKKQKPINN